MPDLVAVSGRQSAALAEVTSAAGQMDMVVRQSADMIEDSGAVTAGPRLGASDLGRPPNY
ncbi:hypothetical protein [Rhizobium sp. NFR03]|uniref:hypothetical protein n=1 Tax=Rhizobium sp. NFR03 TaxID=1566263 RepID=UPI001114BE4B|nr:hypothetical protein [Rhizobium sp. NFR03]